MSTDAQPQAAPGHPATVDDAPHAAADRGPGAGSGDGPGCDGASTVDRDDAADRRRPGRGPDRWSGSQPAGPGTGRRATRGARSGSRSTGLSRAQEPPTTGAAAVDPEPDPESVARSIALRQLTGAPRSRAQLAEAMARRDVPDEVADRVLDRFTEVGLIDDAEYARILVRSRHADRGLARRALGVELRRKGIDDELAAAALDTVDSDQEEATARELVRRRLAATAGLAPEVRMRRVVAMLGRKGYPGGLAHRLVREGLAAETAGGGTTDLGPAGGGWDVDATDGDLGVLTDDD